MSRYIERDDYEDEPGQIHAQGRWERNARATLKSKRGRKALAEMREALLALPEKRLINGALCTVGGPARVPDVTVEAIAARIADRRARADEQGYTFDDEDAAYAALWMRQDADEERDAIAEAVKDQGQGVCLIGAYLWHKQVRAGADPSEAFAALPSVAGGDDDPLTETAHLGQDAGLAYTLAWELAYRNDETYARMTPEGRYTAFLAWLDGKLAGQSQSA
jgi:hypothetical protein